MSRSTIAAALISCAALLGSGSAWAQSSITETLTGTGAPTTVITLQASLDDSITLTTRGRGATGPFTSTNGTDAGTISFGSVDATQGDDTDGADSRLRFVHTDNSFTLVGQFAVDVLYSGHGSVNVTVTETTAPQTGADLRFKCVAPGTPIIWETGGGYTNNDDIAGAPGSACGTYTTPGTTTSRDMDLALHINANATSLGVPYQGVVTVTATGSTP